MSFWNKKKDFPLQSVTATGPIPSIQGSLAVGTSSSPSEDSSSVASPTQNPAKFRAVVDKDTEVTGVLSFDYPVRIEGKVTGGDLFSTTTVVVARDASVQDTHLVAENIVVEGRVKGDLRAAQRVEVLPRAILEGKVCCPDLIVHEEGVLEAECKTTR